MIKILGNAIFRADKKIGWIEENHFFDYTGKRVGYFEDKFVYNEDGHKMAYIEEDFLMPYGGSEESKIRIEKVCEDVVGGVIPAIARASIYILLGS